SASHCWNLVIGSSAGGLMASPSLSALRAQELDQRLGHLAGAVPQRRLVGQRLQLEVEHARRAAIAVAGSSATLHLRVLVGGRLVHGVAPTRSSAARMSSTLHASRRWLSSARSFTSCTATSRA